MLRNILHCVGCLKSVGSADRRSLLILGCVALALLGCKRHSPSALSPEKPAGERAINVRDANGRPLVVIVKEKQWRTLPTGDLHGADKIGKPPENDEGWYDPADQKAFDAVYEYLNGKKPVRLKAD
jgi:hypothetical protein